MIAKLLNCFCFLLVAMFCLTSCKTKEKLRSGGVVESIDEGFLVNHILKNQLDFKSLYFKRINIEFEENGKSMSARANMYIQKDKKIIIQIFFLVEVARISIDSNEIVVINRLEKDVYYTNFDYINKKFHLNLDFNLLQSIFTNMLFSYPDGNPNSVKKYTASSKDGRYLLKSMSESHYERATRNNPDFYYHEIEVIPDGYKIARNGISNLTGTAVDIRYSGFDNFEGTKFPYSLSLSGKKGNDKYGLKMKFSSIDVDSSNTISFKVPDNYGKGVLK